MNAYIKIQNDGEVDVNAFKLMGATTKVEGQIGYFGSGIKYAVASALRKGVPLRVFSGEKEVKITTRKTTMREQEFDVVCINGAPTSITTNMGRDWQDWFILREFYCNAIDEGGGELGVSDTPKGEAGKTSIFIGMTDSMKAISGDMNSYFSFRREPSHVLPGGKVFGAIAKKLVVYRLGIRVFNEGDNNIYDYDFDKLSISEDRTSSDWDVKQAMIDLWRKSATPEMLAQLVSRGTDTVEFKLAWDMGSGRFTDEWLHFLRGKVIIPWERSGFFAEDMGESHHVVLPMRLCVELHQQFGEKLNIRGMKSGDKNITVVDATDREKQYIREAVDFLKKSPLFEDIVELEVNVAVFERARVLGEAKDGKVYLARGLFEHGKRMVVETLLEEYVHAKKQVSDNTREMQNVLLRYVIASMEEGQGVYL